MLNGATDQGQKIFELKCIIFYRTKEGNSYTTISGILHDAGLSHISLEFAQFLWLNCIADPLISIKLIETPNVELDTFSLEQKILVSTNPFYEKMFLDFIDKRIEKVIESFRMSPIGLRDMKEIQKEKDINNKLKTLVKFLRFHPRPLFTY